MSPNESFAEVGGEVRAILRLAAPLATAQIAQVAMGATDTVLLGSLGPDQLAAGGLGANLFFTSVIMVQGGLASIGIVVSHARGAGEIGRIGGTMRGGFLLATFAALPLMVLLRAIAPVLIGIGEPEGLARDIARFEQVLLLGAPAALWLGTQRSYLSAMGWPQLIMRVNLGAVLVNGLLNYGLIHGAFGLPRLGYLGSATATALTLWGVAATVGLGMTRIRALRPYRLFGPIDWGTIRELAALGWPIAITYGIEVTLFLITGLLMGTLGASALAAHQIALNVASLTFMVPFGVAQAANVRVGFHMGGRRPEAARHAAVCSFAIGITFMALAGLTMLSIPRAITTLYLGAGDGAVTALAVRLLQVAALFQIFDGGQTIAAGALRGLKDTRIPMVIAFLGYWCIGLGSAWLFATKWSIGPVGVWWGLALGIASVAILLTLRFAILSSRSIRAAQFVSPTTNIELGRLS
jgi:MATE family multidrug resistance protein